MADTRTTRRGILGATAALPLLIATPAMALPEGEPFQRALAAWRTAEAIAQRHHRLHFLPAAKRNASPDNLGIVAAEADRLAGIADELFDRMVAVPAPDATALAVKMELIFERSEGFELNETYAAAMLADARRFA